MLTLTLTLMLTLTRMLTLAVTDADDDADFDADADADTDAADHQSMWCRSTVPGAKANAEAKLQGRLRLECWPNCQQ